LPTVLHGRHFQDARKAVDKRLRICRIIWRMGTVRRKAGVTVPNIPKLVKQLRQRHGL